MVMTSEACSPAAPVPRYASTVAIPCEVAVTNCKIDNRWLTHIQAAVDDDPDIDTTDGITFLGNGIIRLSAKFLGNMYSHTFDFVVFGVLKSSEDVDMLIASELEDDDPELDELETWKEMWRAVHLTNCSGHACREKYGLDDYKRKLPVREPALSDSPPFDEVAVDRWVNYLYE